MHVFSTTLEAEDEMSDDEANDDEDGLFETFILSAYVTMCWRFFQVAEKHFSLKLVLQEIRKIENDQKTSLLFSIFSKYITNAGMLV